MNKDNINAVCAIVVLIVYSIIGVIFTSIKFIILFGVISIEFFKNCYKKIKNKKWKWKNIVLVLIEMLFIFS